MAFRDEMGEKLERYFMNRPNYYSGVSTKQICRDICDMLPDKSYEDGLNDAWDNARKVEVSSVDGGFSIDEMEAIFDDIEANNILCNYNGVEAAAKIKAYEEEKNKIHIGDEVFSYAFNNKGIVTKIGSNNIITIVCDKISSISTSIDKVYKTGKSYPQIFEYYKFLEQYSKDKKESEETNNE